MPTPRTTQAGSNIYRKFIVKDGSTPNGSHVYNKTMPSPHTTPLGSHQSVHIHFYKHIIPSGLTKTMPTPRTTQAGSNIYRKFIFKDVRPRMGRMFITKRCQHHVRPKRGQIFIENLFLKMFDPNGVECL